MNCTEGWKVNRKGQLTTKGVGKLSLISSFVKVSKCNKFAKKSTHRTGSSPVSDTVTVKSLKTDVQSSYLEQDQ